MEEAQGMERNDTLSSKQGCSPKIGGVGYPNIHHGVISCYQWVCVSTLRRSSANFGSRNG